MGMSQIFTQDTLRKKLLTSTNKEMAVTHAATLVTPSVAVFLLAVVVVLSAIVWRQIDRKNYVSLFILKENKDSFSKNSRNRRGRS